MHHISVNLPFGRRENKIWRYKKLQGAAKGYKGTPTNSVDLFNWFIFWYTLNFLWRRQKISRGRQMVTLRHWLRPWIGVICIIDIKWQYHLTFTFQISNVTLSGIVLSNQNIIFRHDKEQRIIAIEKVIGIKAEIKMLKYNVRKLG